MRVLINIAIISALFGADALAAGVAPNSRARPGSVTGAMINNAKTQQVKSAQEPYTTQGLDVNNCPGCKPAPHTKPTTNQPNTDSTCGEVLPLLGVDACIARKACSGIQADGHSGVFDETTSTCKIPVCAHNWSGIIRKDDEDVCALVEMNKAITCNADLFDQIDSMRRSSQWVVPLAVVGGAGIGAGIGAIIDKNQNEKAEKLASIADANEAEIKATGGKTLTLKFAGKTYKLPEDIDALKKALRGDATLQVKISEANTLIDNCTASMFEELTSQQVNNKPKWGRIKLTTNGLDCESPEHNNNKVKYCQFQNMRANVNEIADCAKNLYKGTPFNDEYQKGVNSTNPFSSYFKSWGEWTRDATCYFRDSLGSGEANISATIQADLATTELINKYIARGNDGAPSDFRKNLVAALKKFEFNSSLTTSGVSGSDNDVLNWVTVKSTDGKTTFSSVGGTCDKSKLNEILKVDDDDMTGGISNNILFEAYGALAALKSFNSLDSDLDSLLTVLGDIDTFGGDVLTIQEGLGDDIRKDLGKKRPFFKTATGRGLLIGSGVGAVAGLGYWFAEGSSTFCNVGGMEQVKLKKSYSIPSFRDYLFNKGFIK